jgi:hypothetical protein
MLYIKVKGFVVVVDDETTLLTHETRAKMRTPATAGDFGRALAMPKN